MADSISPYALLKASKPRPMPVMVTSYDLFSAVHNQAASPAPSPAPAAMQEAVQPPTAKPLMTPSARTHYIADIHARHNMAVRQNRPIYR